MTTSLRFINIERICNLSKKTAFLNNNTGLGSCNIQVYDTFYIFGTNVICIL